MHADLPTASPRRPACARRRAPRSSCRPRPRSRAPFAVRRHPVQLRGPRRLVLGRRRYPAVPPERPCLPPLLPGVLDLGAAGRATRSRCTRSRRAAPAPEPAAAPTCTARTRTCARRIASCGRPSRARARRRRTSCRGASAACRRERPPATTARRRSTAPALARADLVTLTLGGNDAGYVDVLVTCGLGNCNTRAFERSRAAIIDRTKPRLEKVYRAIAAKAPHARILVLGYPQPFPAAKARQACPALSPFQGEQDMLRRLGTRLNGTIASAVATRRPLGCAGSRTSRWRAGSRATRSVAARARGSTGSSRARPGSG